ncbi:hypothetical protein L6J37_04000 [Photobacterium sp. WH77]|uniref:hypothetical protein n=1 Tax=unclassified Photobacterium TaxID=2628852 RepID=UPI001EDC01C4|nr:MULTISPECIES: hypothetical protein [unclassified Photobacterium]MCG2836022.1 hypothetical protein [Photobacterium sp. WH77]MCG2843843.1 hypothetical protein [Photobacterium sp. WH80]
MIKFFRNVFNLRKSSIYSEMDKKRKKIEYNEVSVSERFNNEILFLEELFLIEFGCCHKMSYISKGVKCKINPIHVSGSIMSLERPIINSKSEYTDIYIMLFFSNAYNIVSDAYKIKNVRVYLVNGEFLYQFALDDDIKIKSGELVELFLI